MESLKRRGLSGLPPRLSGPEGGNHGSISSSLWPPRSLRQDAHSG